MFRKHLYSVIVLIVASCTSRHTLKTDYPDCATFKPKGIFTSLQLDSNLSRSKTAVYTLESGGNSFFARAWLWQNAARTIDIQHYIFKKDKTGRVACDYLLRAADRGVKVRLLLDEIAVKRGARLMALMDSHENIEVKIYNPGFIYSKSFGYRIKKLLTQMKRLTMRMHIKTITVDNGLSIMGGRNVADEYFDFDHRYNFRDRDIVIIGKNAKEVAEVFNAHWNDTLSVSLSQLVNENKRKFKKNDRFERLHGYACNPKHFSAAMRTMINGYPRMFDTIKKKDLIWLNDVSFVADEPGKNGNREGRGGLCTDSVVALLKSARDSLIIQTPYVIFNEDEEQLFKELLGRGVKIKVLTNSMGSTDNFEAFSGYKRDRQKLLEMGIDIYEFKSNPGEKRTIMVPEEQEKINYKPPLGLHSKTMVIDDKTSVIGTYNLDPRSADLNTECIAVMRSGEFTSILMKYINEEFKPENSWHVTKDFNPDKKAGLWKRFKVATRRGVPKSFL